MTVLISSLVSLVIGFIGGMLVYRKHAVKLKEAEEKLEKAEEIIKKMVD